MVNGSTGMYTFTTHVKESIWRELVLQMGIGGDGLSFWAGVEV